MDNEAQPNIPPVQQLPQIPITPPPTNWLRIITFIIFGLIIVTGGVVVGIKIGKNQSLNNPQLVGLKATVSPTQTEVNTTAFPSQTIISPTISIVRPNLSPEYLGAVFSSSSSAFIKSSNDRSSTIQNNTQNPPIPTLPDVKFKSVCETSGGKWYERKGKDLPMALCICEYNNWRERNLENIVERGCDCSMSCKGLDNQFSDFDFSSVANNPKPSLIPPDPTNRYLIFRDELSQCSYLAVVNNSCIACTTNQDCGESGSGGSNYWLQNIEKSVCDNGKCRYRRVIYAEIF